MYMQSSYILLILVYGGTFAHIIKCLGLVKRLGLQHNLEDLLYVFSYGTLATAYNLPVLKASLVQLCILASNFKDYMDQLIQ